MEEYRVSTVSDSNMGRGPLTDCAFSWLVEGRMDRRAVRQLHDSDYTNGLTGPFRFST